MPCLIERHLYVLNTSLLRLSEKDSSPPTPRSSCATITSQNDNTEAGTSAWYCARAATEMRLVLACGITSGSTVCTSVGGACVVACAGAWSGARCTAGRSFHTTSGVALACLMYDGPE